MSTTCAQMLADRGCTHVTRFAPEAPDSPLVVGTGGPRDFAVYLAQEERVGVRAARQLLEKHASDDVGLIVVSPDGPTPCARKELAGGRIQFFPARALVQNVTHHSLVPRHEAVPQPPMGLDRNALPTILETDPVVQYHAWPVGTILRTERPFGGHELIPYYRVVVPAP